MATSELSTQDFSGRAPLPSEEYIPKVMPPILGTFDMTAAYVIALFLIPNAALTATGGPVALVYLIVGAITFFIPCVIAAAQLGVMFPHEGSLYNWTYKALGRYWGFFIGLCFWLSGILAVVTGSDAFVTTIQGLNNSWLSEPWQQGLVIVAIVTFVGIMGTQRYRIVQNTFNVVFCLTLIPVVLMATSVVVWFATGHASMTNFNNRGDWSINPANFALFGLIALNYIGASGPLNMAGELTERKVVTHHLLWGTLIVFIAYFVATFSVLVVRGQAIFTAAVLPFEVVTTVDTVLGKFAGNIVAICILSYFVFAVFFYASASSRLLLAAGIDQRIPATMGRLNKNRVPANAIIFQCIAAAVITIFIFIVAPYVVKLGTPVNLVTMFFTVNSASLTIIWTIATAFFFVDLVGIYIRDPKGFRQKRIFPMPLIWASAVIGFAASALTIIDTLFNSWIPQLIGNGTWWYVIGGLAVACLIISAIASMLANSEADWEGLSK